MAFMRRYGIGGAILAILFGLASCDLSDRIDPQRPEVVEPVPEADLADAPAIESADVDAFISNSFEAISILLSTSNKFCSSSTYLF